MNFPRSKRRRIGSGVERLDELLDNLFIGDNVVWHDDSGSLAHIYCLKFIEASYREKRPIIYVSFDRSPRNLLDKLGHLAENPLLTILDCFTWGKGAGSDVFLKFYEDGHDQWSCNIVKVQSPKEVSSVMDSVYGVHATMTGDVRFVFESITGMQELWGGEEQIIRFYMHSCPRLYELNTVAYWLLEKKAHSSRLRAQINQIAQVAIELSIKRGTTYLTVIKAEERLSDNLHRPQVYRADGLTLGFESEGKAMGRLRLGTRVKELRSKKKHIPN